MKQIHKDFMFRFRGAWGIVVLAPIMCSVLLSKPFFSEGSFLDIVVEGCGWLFFGVYALFRLWATMYIGGRKDRELQTAGPYSLCRNPLYFGSFCFALACSLFFQSILLLIGTFILAGIYYFWIIPAEEKVLQGIFPVAFNTYCSKTSRVLPLFRNYEEPPLVTVSTNGVKLEFKRLLLASFLPAVSEIVMCLRSADWWPQIFSFA